MLWNGSNDLKLVVVALNNSIKKRMELASRATAGWLNNSVFGMAGPVKSLARYLGATGERAGECFFDVVAQWSRHWAGRRLIASSNPTPAR
jgi:hypothetical protein